MRPDHPRTCRCPVCNAWFQDVLGYVLLVLFALGIVVMIFTGSFFS